MVFLFDTLWQRVERGMTVKNNKEYSMGIPSIKKAKSQASPKTLCD